MAETGRGERYAPQTWRPLPGEVSARLSGLTDVRWSSSGLRLAGGHESVSEQLVAMDAWPWTVIVYCEHLAAEHWRRKAYVRIRRERIISELDETVWRHFSRPINEEMSRYLEDHRDPDDVFLDTLVRKYRPRAATILRSRYQEFYPRAWKRKWETGKHRGERIRERRERRYDLPAPLDWWDSRNPFQQYYFVPEADFMAVGGSGSSGQREQHSLIGYTFALFRRHTPVPTFLLAYDRHNRVRFVDEFKDLCLVDLCLGSNYQLGHAEHLRLLRGVRLVRAERHPDDWMESDLSVQWTR